MKRRVLIRALWHRRGRALVAFGAVAIACSLAVSVLQVAVDAGAKLRGELRVFGANVALLPADGAGISAAAIDRFAAGIDAARLRGCSPVLETTAAAGGRQVAVVGVRWHAAPALFSYWQLDGRWPEARTQNVCLIGARLAKVLDTKSGNRLTLTGSDGSALITRVGGIIRAGDQADDQCFIALPEAQRLAGRPGMASLGLAALSGDAPQVERLAARSAAGLPGLVARPIGVLSQSEGRLLGRARWLMLAASVAVLLLAVLAVLTTSIAGALDREPELALLKALGWEDREAATLFLAEAAVVGLTAGALAATLGLAGGRVLARSLFHTTMAFHPAALLLALVLGAGVALLGAAVPARRVLRLDPARALRNE